MVHEINHPFLGTSMTSHDYGNPHISPCNPGWWPTSLSRGEGCCCWVSGGFADTPSGSHGSHAVLQKRLGCGQHPSTRELFHFQSWSLHPLTVDSPKNWSDQLFLSVELLFLRHCWNQAYDQTAVPSNKLWKSALEMFRVCGIMWGPGPLHTGFGT